MTAHLLLFGKSPSQREQIESLFANSGNFVIKSESDLDRAMALARSWRPHALLVHSQTSEVPAPLFKMMRGDARLAETLLLWLAPALEEVQIVTALQAGADDVIDARSAPKEIFWRVVAVLRRSPSRPRAGAAPLRSGEIRL